MTIEEFYNIQLQSIEELFFLNEAVMQKSLETTNNLIRFIDPKAELYDYNEFCLDARNDIENFLKKQITTEEQSFFNKSYRDDLTIEVRKVIVDSMGRSRIQQKIGDKYNFDEFIENYKKQK